MQLALNTLIFYLTTIEKAGKSEKFPSILFALMKLKQLDISNLSKFC